MIVGAVVGLFGGLAHLIVIVNRHDADRGRGPKQGEP
jgi:hypothetical protein